MRARKVAGFSRITVTPTDEQSMLLFVAEYDKGNLGLFQGDDDPQNDQFVVLEPENAKLVVEAVKRRAPDPAWPR